MSMITIASQRAEPFSQELVEKALLPVLERTDLPEFAVEVRQKMRFREDLAFIRFNSPANPQYVEFFLLNDPLIEEPARNQATQAIAIREALIERQLEAGEFQLGQRQRRPTSKFELAEFERDSVTRLLSIKDASLREELGEINRGIDRLVDSKVSLRELARKTTFQRSPEKEKEVKQFLAQIRTQKEKRRQKVQEHSIRVNQLRRKLDEEARMKDQELASKRHQELLHQHEESESVRKSKAIERFKKNEEFKKYLQEFRKKKPLHISKEESFNDELAREQKEREVYFRQLKKNSKPLDHEQLEQHMKHYQEELQLRQQRRLEMRKVVDSMPIANDYYKGEHYARSLSDMGRTAEQAENMKRVKQFDQEVRSSHKPTPSPRKRQELLSLIEQIHRKKSKQVDERAALRVGNLYLQQLRSVPKKNKSVAESGYQPELTDRPARIDYLAERRGKRKTNQNRSSDWKKDLENPQLGKQERYERVMQSVSQLSTKLERQEQLLRIKPNNRKKLQLDEDYLQSINAKMALLKGAHET